MDLDELLSKIGGNAKCFARDYSTHRTQVRTNHLAANPELIEEIDKEEIQKQMSTMLKKLSSEQIDDLLLLLCVHCGGTAAHPKAKHIKEAVLEYQLNMCRTGSYSLE